MKSITTKLVLLLLIFCSSNIFSQSKAELKKSAFRDAQIAANATLKSDYNTLLKHTYPPIVEIMGGTENAINTIKSMMENMKSQGFVFEKAEVINVSDIVKENDQYRCYVENNNEMKMTGMKIKSKSFLLGMYDSEKKIWYFLEAERLKNKALADKILPNFKTALKIPDDEVTTQTIED